VALSVSAYESYLASRSPHTKRAYEYVIGDFLGFLRRTGMRPGTEAVQAYLNFVSKKNSPTTVRHRLSIVKSYLGYMDIGFNPKRVSIPRWNRKPKMALDHEQLQMYFEEVGKIRSDRMKALLMILPFTGVRIAEACGDKASELPGICRRDIFRHDGRYFVRVTGKGNKTRNIPLDSTAEKILAAYMRVHKQDKLFDIQPVTVRAKMQVIGLRVGIEGLSPHTMRHTFITELIERGVPLNAVQELAGHSNPSTTLGYAHASEQSKRSAVTNMYRS